MLLPFSFSFEKKSTAIHSMRSIGYRHSLGIASLSTQPIFLLFSSCELSLQSTYALPCPWEPAIAITEQPHNVHSKV